MSSTGKHARAGHCGALAYPHRVGSSKNKRYTEFIESGHIPLEHAVAADKRAEKPGAGAPWRVHARELTSVRAVVGKDPFRPDSFVEPLEDDSVTATASDDEKSAQAPLAQREGRDIPQASSNLDLAPMDV
jgi:hypothetical protein